MGLLDDNLSENAFEKCKKAILKDIALWGIAVLSIVFCLAMIIQLSLAVLPDMTVQDWYIIPMLLLMIVVTLVGLFWMIKKFWMAIKDYKAKTVVEFKATVVDKERRRAGKTTVYFLHIENKAGKLEKHAIDIDQYEKINITNEVTMYLGVYSRRCYVVEEV